MVNTVLGKIKASQMGVTSVHEHISGALIKTVPEYLDEEAECVVNELVRAKETGLDTIIEVSQCPRLEPEQLMKIAKRSPVNIVCSTGFYCFWTDEEKKYSIDQFLEHILYEAENGIGGSGIMPGVIKIASYRPILLPCEIRALTAAGRAQKLTGLPMCVHSSTGTRYQQYLIEAAGANMDKVYFSHMESPTDRENRTPGMQIEYMLETMRRGSYVSLNGFCYPAYIDPNYMGDMVKKTVEAGFGHKLLLSLDGWWQYREGKRWFVDKDETGRRYPYLMETVVPWLTEYGVSRKDLDTMLIDNVAALFG